MPIKLFYILLFLPIYLMGQGYQISGTVFNAEKEPLSFVNVLLFEENNETPLKGTTTGADGSFLFEEVDKGGYVLEFTMIGFQKKQLSIQVSSENNLGNIILLQEEESLDEITVKAKRPFIQRANGKLIFTVENSSLSTGSAYELLSKTPGVIVLGPSTQIKNRPTTVYFNGRRIYLSSSEINSFLKNLDAASIKSVEVITNPGPEFDAESGTVLNIITSKAINPGYKGSLSGNYRQAVFAKYQIGTSHFFKNNWLNLYGSYSYSPRKENKDQDTYIRFTRLDPSETSAIWESDFNRITRSYAHQANMVADIDFDENNSLNVTASLLSSPDKEFNNQQFTSIFGPNRELDSTFATRSLVLNDTRNISAAAEYKAHFREKGPSLTVGGGYINYNSDQSQTLKSDYELPDGTFLNSIQFNTLSFQDTDILTAYADFNTPVITGDLVVGVKYSDIDTRSGLDFFDVLNGAPEFNGGLSDIFEYRESIFAAYFNFDKSWENWRFSAGLRGENTDVNGDSASLGLVNTQSYFKLFPSASLRHNWTEQHSMELSYARKIQRPRYQSLNPFRYFVNENNFNVGNPNLVPAIDDKLTLSYSYKNSLFIEAYYQSIDNSLEILNFQDNENFTIRQLDANILNFKQYSFDVIYSSSFTERWFASLITSTYYLENEFLALESEQTSYTNSTMGFFGQAYSQYSFDKEGSLLSELTVRYISNLISGSLDYNNIFNTSFSIRKTFWNKSAQVSIGVDDIFNTNNVKVVSRYFNQDNSYFARPESRMFWVGFRYNFGNYALKDNNRNLKSQESDRLD